MVASFQLPGLWGYTGGIVHKGLSSQNMDSGTLSGKAMNWMRPGWGLGSRDAAKRSHELRLGWGCDKARQGQGKSGWGRAGTGPRMSWSQAGTRLRSSWDQAEVGLRTGWGQAMTELRASCERPEVQLWLSWGITLTLSVILCTFILALCVAALTSFFTKLTIMSNGFCCLWIEWNVFMNMCYQNNINEKPDESKP